MNASTHRVKRISPMLAVADMKETIRFYTDVLRFSVRMESEKHVVFVGDDWRADVDGPAQIGMKSVLYRDSGDRQEDCDVIRNWDEFRPQLHNQSEHSTPRGCSLSP
jgi:catechol 2,3-dioxygenase-like lactoylglutathione lyase family enzyme